MRKALLYGLLLTVSGVICFAQERAESSKPDRMTANEYERKVCKTFKGNYLLYLPSGYDQSPEKKWPMMLFLHGAGERGDNLDRVRLHGPPKLIDQGKEFPFIVVAPQCPAEQWWDSQSLLALVDEIVEKYRVDQDRLYLTGLSMGGFGSWALVTEEPYRFAAVAPICGGDPRNTRKLRHLPIWVFHGAKDNLVPLQRSQEMVDALEAVGNKPQFTIYPEAGHDSWTQAYNTDELYDWFLKQTVVLPPLTVGHVPYLAGKSSEIKLRSLRVQPINVEVDFNGNKQTVEVDPNGQSVTLPIPADARGPLEVRLLLDGRQEQNFWLLPAELDVPEVSNIQIDGALTDWPEEAQLAEGMMASKNFAPQIYLGWSPEGLYLAGKIPARHLKAADPTRFWGGAYLELFADTGNNSQGWPETSHHFWFMPTRETPESPWKGYAGEWKRSPAIEATIYEDARGQTAVDVGEDYVTIEAFIPTESLKQAPQAGRPWKIGLSVGAESGSASWPRSKDAGLLDKVGHLGEAQFIPAR